MIEKSVKKQGLDPENEARLLQHVQNCPKCRRIARKIVEKT